MNNCPVCGSDVSYEGLCPECDKERRQKTGQVSFKTNRVFLFSFVGIFLFLLVGLFVFFQVGQIIEAQELNKNIGAPSTEAALCQSGLADTSSNQIMYDITQVKDHPSLYNKEEYIDWMVKNQHEKLEYLEQRWELSRVFIESKELAGDAVIEAFLRTPREHFVREPNLARAYNDTWLPVGYGATITDPDVVCMMTTSLNVEPQHRVLEIGTGSGYQSAILSRLSNHVYTIEIIEPLAEETDRLYKNYEAAYPAYHNIHRKTADGFYGWSEHAPFDRIIITCAIDHVPPPLIQQLAVDGIIVAPIGPPGRQHIMQMKKVIDDDNNVVLTRKDVYDGLSVRFIPFRDKEGKSYNRS